ncbi:hypothetical protein FVQ98_04465 [Ottowia sp. GY511]|uniref:DUF3108 domain-containing protein n=1 Tax=Ottowia flava TaxID=2675430 RepID=A0ABW4KYF3_9BURK|nr:hypothetical protein [Ottowia sp. GY511]TXK31240.1 hypothetical protein FVQ98_04465 [Ottowia sp. GY511]
MSLHFSSLAKLTLTALCAATLVACGGGDDEKPHVPLSSECVPPTTLATATSNYQVNWANGTAAVRHEVLTINEVTQYEGKTVVRSRAAGRSTYSAPVNVQGDISYDAMEEYYDWNSDNSRSYHGTASSEKYGTDADQPPQYRFVADFSPAMVDKDYTPLVPGQQYDSPINGKALVTENEVTKPIILNGSTRHTYVGQETIAVPAGNLLACKFSRYPGDGTVQHDWVQHGTGMLLRRLNVDAKGVVQLDQQLINTTGFR